MRRRAKCLEPMDLDIIPSVFAHKDQEAHATYFDGLRIEFEAILIDQEFLNVLTLITLKLNHLAHLTVDDNCAIASYYPSANVLL